MAKNKYIETPDKLWDLFEAYRKDVKSKPFKVKDWVGKDGFEVDRLKEKPLTMEGFENYVFRQNKNTELAHYFSNREERYTDYVTICRAIRNEIRQDQIEGGMACVYNPSITARINGLADKIDSTVTSVPILNVDPLSDKEEKK
jgi:hypothetical protein